MANPELHARRQRLNGFRGHGHNGPISIGDEVWIGPKATVLRGVTVGERSVVAVCPRVATNVPGGCLWLPDGWVSRRT
jgi:acetyltransferase-like isoleucine patch superfamily enzyme